MKMPNFCVILIILDSVRADILYELVQTNRMPYLKKYIFDRAAVAENCFTSFPTNTVPGHLAILTGTYADKHHVPAMKLWNLSKMHFRDYSGISIFDLLKQEFNPKIKMIYNFFSDSEAFTASSFAKGARYTYLNRNRMIFFYLIQKLNYKIVLIQSLKVLLRHLKKKITGMLYVIWIPITDIISHEKGPDSQELLHNLQEIDQMLFKLLFEGYKKWKGFKELGSLNSTYFFITADHGSFTIRKRSKLIQNFKSIPLRIKHKQAPLKTLNKSDLLIAYTDGFASLYVKNPISNNWNDKVEYSQLITYPTSKGPINLIEFILKIPTVSHVFVKKEKVYLIFSIDGTSQIKRKTENGEIFLSYQVLSGKDPFDYNKNHVLNELRDGTFYPYHKLVEPLSKTNYPTMLDQIPRLFNCENMGDILFMGKEGCSFNQKNNYRGTHDTGTYLCSRVPFIAAGPNIKHIRIPTVRTVDIVPTILYLLKKSSNYQQFDGRVLSEIIKE
ncbi:MAG: alkaline phosphatase family protein [Promethearchaeota archaeon]